jgi:hypothetical protein
MKTACQTQPFEKDGRLMPPVGTGDRRALAIFVSALQSLVFLLLLLQGDWGQARQNHVGRGQALADAQDTRNLLTTGSETPRALASSADRQRGKARASDAPEATPPCQACQISRPDGHSLHADAHQVQPNRLESSAYRARAPPRRVI